MDGDAYQSERGRLEYRETDFEKTELPGGVFDLVVFNRTLHHIHNPAQALAKVATILRPGTR